MGVGGEQLWKTVKGTSSGKSSEFSAYVAENLKPPSSKLLHQINIL